MKPRYFMQKLHADEHVLRATLRSTSAGSDFITRLKKKKVNKKQQQRTNTPKKKPK